MSAWYAELGLSASVWNARQMAVSGEVTPSTVLEIPRRTAVWLRPEYERILRRIRNAINRPKPRIAKQLNTCRKGKQEDYSVFFHRR